MTFPIAIIPYTNMAPYMELGTPRGCEFILFTPHESVAALFSKRVIAAAVPVGGLSAVAELTEPLGCFGIAARKRCMSVMFFADRPLDAVDATTRIHVTNESASSVRLLYLLLGYRNGFDNLPAVAGPHKRANGELLIGDDALKKRWAWNRDAHSPMRARYKYMIDLAQEWYALYSLPFVFARWVIRKDAPPDARAALEEWLVEFKKREPELINSVAPRAAQKLNMPLKEVLTYLNVISRSLDESDLAGQARFLGDIVDCGLETKLPLSVQMCSQKRPWQVYPPQQCEAEVMRHEG